MEQTEFDPLVALDADYAATIGQDKLCTDICEPLQQQCDAKSADSESDNEESALGSYNLLQSSPRDSDDDSPDLSSGLDGDIDNENDTELHPISLLANTEVISRQNDAHIHEEKRTTIIQSMKKIKLRPPPWAQASKLTDDELIDMVQEQLRLKSS